MDREMQIRNYSERTIKSYICSVGQVARYYNLPPSQVTIDQFKAHLHHLINNQNCSVSRINQDISAWKILQQDIFGRKWEAVKVKRPRRERKLPVVLSMSEARALIQASRGSLVSTFTIPFSIRTPKSGRARGAGGATMSPLMS